MKAEEFIKDVRNTAEEHSKMYEASHKEHLVAALAYVAVAVFSLYKAMDHYGLHGFFAGAHLELDSLNKMIDENLE